MYGPEDQDGKETLESNTEYVDTGTAVRKSNQSKCFVPTHRITMSSLNSTPNKFANVLPVLFYEYLAISITKSLIPAMLVDQFQENTYFAVGIMETIKGLLAFISCPLFGRLSDKIGRKYCLLVTVVGTTLPVCILVFTSNMYVFAVAMSISGFFSATFPLTFAYISD
jgi:MFS family permease